MITEHYVFTFSPEGLKRIMEAYPDSFLTYGHDQSIRVSGVAPSMRSLADVHTNGLKDSIIRTIYPKADLTRLDLILKEE